MYIYKSTNIKNRLIKCIYININITFVYIYIYILLLYIYFIVFSLGILLYTQSASLPNTLGREHHEADNNFVYCLYILNYVMSQWHILIHFGITSSHIFLIFMSLWHENCLPVFLLV